MKRFGSATWNGDLREGRGSVSTEGRVRSSAATVKSRAPIRRSCLGWLMPPDSWRARTERINAIGTS
jgi:hypothetical protein